jgi:hypothetical protein
MVCISKVFAVIHSKIKQTQFLNIIGNSVTCRVTLKTVWYLGDSPQIPPFQVARIAVSSNFIVIAFPESSGGDEDDSLLK